jgi:hypothetical protein
MLFQFSGKRSEAIPHFSSIDYPMPSEFFNPADHLLDLVSIDPRQEVEADKTSRRRVEGLTSAWRQKGVGETGEEMIGEGGVDRQTTKGGATTRMWIALPVVLERHWKNLWRRKDVCPDISMS